MSRVQVTDLSVGDIVYRADDYHNVMQYEVVGRTACTAEVKPMTGPYTCHARWMRKEVYTTFNEAIDAEILKIRGVMDSAVRECLSKIEELNAVKQ